MITQEQQHALHGLLRGKKLPLDLKMEILDHMTEQALYKMELQEKSFESALAEIDNEWKKDLVLKRILFWKPATVFQWKIERRKEKTLVIKTLLYFTVYLAISIFLAFYDETIAGNFIFLTHLLAVSIFGLYLLFNFKIIKTVAGTRSGMNISFLQKGAQILFVSSVFIPSMILFDFTTRFQKYLSALHQLAHFTSPSARHLGSLLIMNLYFFMWILGYLYFLEYRKTVRFLQNKTHLKL